MSLLSDKIKQLLTQYDQRKGFFRFFFRDPPAIKALRELTLMDKDNIFKVYQCFVGNLPKEEEVAYFVYEALMKRIVHSSDRFVLEDVVYLLDFLIKENLTTKNISNLVCELCAYMEINSLTRLLEYLKHSQILTQENLDDMNPDDFLIVWMVLKKISTNRGFGLLSQEMLALLKQSSDAHLSLFNILLGSNLVNSQNLVRWLQLQFPENSFLLTEAAFGIAWNRIPSHLLTQAVFDHLMTLSQQENPRQRIEQYVNQLIGRNREFVINDAQNTHHASVHQSVSDSARKLFDLYNLMIEGKHLEQRLQMIRDYIGQLPDNSIKNIAAKRCFERIVHFEFIDPGSNLTIPQLLVLSFLAINDTDKRIGDLSDAREQFVEGLYEIQRGYNLSENGHDLGGPDKFICTSGTFNKLIEKLEGIHPDVQVLHVNKAIASLKLPIVVREAARDYLSNIAQPQTIEGFRRFTQLIKQMRQDECIEVIWDHIKPKIVDRMFEEFGSLYTGKKDSRLLDLVEPGQYLTFYNLSRFQEQIVASLGYKHYCSQILRSPLNFFSPQTATDSDSTGSPPSRDISRRIGS